MPMNYSMCYRSPLGELTLVCNENALVSLCFQDQSQMLSKTQNIIEPYAAPPVLKLTAEWLDAYFSGKRPNIAAIPLAPQGSSFQQKVWEILCTIAYGNCTTYGAIATQMADALHKRKMSSQAVGGAVGHNPIAIIIPCHRVIGTSGNLTGYGGGIDRKISLLELEGVNISRLSLPRSGKYAIKRNEFS